MNIPMCARLLEFDAGHRLINHEGKCRHAHGHRYKAELTCRAKKLDDVGRVIDFGVIKTVVGKWLDDEFDHGFIFCQGDPLIESFRATGQKHRVLAVNPTAENLAVVIAGHANELLAEHGVEVVQVKLWETPNCFATWKAD